MVVTITPLTDADIPSAVTAIQASFAEDPYFLWLNDTKNFSHERNRASLTVRCKWGIENALFHVAKDPESNEPNKVLGIAMWMPPKPVDQLQTWKEWYEDWKLWANQVKMNLWYGRGGLNVKRYYIWKSKQAEAQSAIWTDDKGYYFLNIMVVIPGQQGKGVGKKLAREVTRRADEEGRKCYLESSRDVPNMAIYETMGFKYVRKLMCEDEGESCPLYCMVRDPKTVE